MLLSTVKKMYMKNSGKNLFWSIENSVEILDKLKARDFNATSLSTLDFSTLYTTLPHKLIKDKHIEKTLITLHVTTETHSLLQKNIKKTHAWSCQNVCDALNCFLNNIFIRFGTTLHRQVIVMPMGTKCAPLIANLFLFLFL